MNKTRSLFLVCFLLLSSLFAFNSYAGEVTISWKGGTYTGEIASGIPHGDGTWTLSDGRKYVGEWKVGLPNGQGTLTHPDGRKYVGEFNVGKYHGRSGSAP